MPVIRPRFELVTSKIEVCSDTTTSAARYDLLITNQELQSNHHTEMLRYSNFHVE
jgi:hypothetical protein